MKATTKRKIRKIISPIRRCGLKNKSFSIISNNCWGGYVYDYFGLRYKTPTIGLYFSSNDYIKFVSNLKYYLSLEVTEAEPSEKCKIRGKLGDIFINFVHYSSFEDAKEKWSKRAKRIDFNNMLIKFNDQNEFEKSNFIDFKKLSYNKVFFTVNSDYCSDFTYVFKDKKHLGYVENDIKDSFKYFNVKRTLNLLIKY